MVLCCAWCRIRPRPMRCWKRSLEPICHASASRGAHEATSYLIAQGHRRIGHIAGDLRYSTGRARLAGYQRALADHGIAADEALVYSDDWAPAVARVGVTRLLDLSDRPTAIFAASDTFAL